MNKRTIQTAAAAVITLAVLALIAGLVVKASQPPAAQKPQAFVTQGMDEDPQVKKLREQLSQKGLSDASRKELEEKLQLAERSAAQRAEGKAAPKGDKVAPPPAAAAIARLETLEEGIFEGSQGLVRPSQGEISNVWQGSRDGVGYQVFAGASAEQPPHGMLIVVTLTDGGPTGKRETYFAPEDITQLRILEVKDSDVLVETDAGGKLNFNLVSREFTEK